jgi:hypothetical protein
MELEKRLKLLQLFYAGVIADSVSCFERFGITGQVEIKKMAEQKIMAKGQLAQLNIKTHEELFAVFSEIFGCVDWKLSKTANELTAESSRCLLCGISKKMDTVQPCNMYCINPMKSLSAALEPGMQLHVEKTLWDSEKCLFRLTGSDDENLLKSESSIQHMI